MAEVENKDAPWFGGWMIAAAAGLVVAAVCIVVGGFDLTPAGFVGAVVFLLAGLVLHWAQSRVPERPMPVAKSHAAHEVAAAPSAPVAAPVMAAPVTASAPLMTPAAPLSQQRPAALAAARGGKADDLKIIKGIGPKLEILCHSLGFFHFDQLAAWTDSEVAWVDENLEGFKGRVTRDRWVPQAQAIVKMGPEEFLRRLDQGEEF
jgi:predicted flap endonuclease-1-like 5' DNA nuclease